MGLQCRVVLAPPAPLWSSSLDQTHGSPGPLTTCSFWLQPPWTVPESQLWIEPHLWGPGAGPGILGSLTCIFLSSSKTWLEIELDCKESR